MNPRMEIEQAVRYLKLALPEMSKREIPTTPNNYAVWFEYVVGANKELSKVVDAYTKAGKAFTEVINDDLYRRFIANRDQAAVNSIRDSIRQLINALLRRIASEENGLNDYCNTLERLADEVERSQDPEGLGGLIQQLLQETHRRETSARDMKESLDKMSSEIERLKSEVERLSTEASTDPLTRVNNRRSFDIAMQQAIGTANTTHEGLCLLMIDVDHFKLFNDRYGHSVGDKVLRFLGDIFRQHFKGQDTVARIGGEEFAVLLPDTPPGGGVKTAESLRQRVARQNLKDGNTDTSMGTVTISIGAALYRHGESTEDFIKRADKLLYAAKAKGRNCIVTEPDYMHLLTPDIQIREPDTTVKDARSN